MRISPDGGIVIFTVTHRDPVANRSTSHFLKVPTSGGAAVEMYAVPENARDLRWSPDGTRIAFLTAQAVWVLDVMSGRPATDITTAIRSMN